MKKVAVIFGGMSTEHDVSIMSGISVLKNIDNKKYKVYAVYIDKKGIWYRYNSNTIKELLPNNLVRILNITEYLKKMDVVFPILHGLYGEDGTIQGLLKMLNIPFVGCGVLSSSVAMDKVYTKIIFQKAGILQAKYVYIKMEKDRYIVFNDKFDEKIIDLNDIYDVIQNKLKFPVFVKPSNSGSSVGVNKATDKESLISCIKEASKYDSKILIEEQIIARELECGVLGNEEIMTSCVGEIISAGDFYDYNSKYKDKKSITKIPADISNDISKKIQEITKKAFKAIDAKGIARVDFFLDKDNNIYINEINTLPGFTNISMYPKLFENSGICYTELLTKLIELGCKK